MWLPICDSLSLVQDLLPGLELQITEIVGLAEIYLENIMHQAGHKLENATTIFKGTDGRPKRDLTYKQGINLKQTSAIFNVF